jgi:hypothetical protein
LLIIPASAGMGYITCALVKINQLLDQCTDCIHREQEEAE